mmetsp:Transcript_38899/g.70148  ORF Transcript_38899/g.70148 Transcript_38899/m.70148 type:complete len:992 (+) Transcript_38899:42-3017(+)|eukprot:CAMPEP_0197663140 /NCGR_PEP_ID=MMETSP1338-20131121/56250_1 /TAXON_ID=43686 ORGANISM="Pelagodinium beii, Strain RCC1491" /NCGR_SAMPLE_ID=MMETSP1338 /ASSEMBLY_ACC=CAM_ASM_000754 /LENGTH=991 /DNA_ID=CAMNT_0043241361 /DNA_START=42 /DNA_END=3017 /DNA_ORIENTATION=-
MSSLSPDTQASQWKSIAQSQSPPSFSPLRRTQREGEESGSSGDEGEGPAKVGVGAFRQSGRDSVSRALLPDEDDDSQEGTSMAPGVQVLRSSRGGAASEESDEEAEEADAGAADVNMVAPSIELVPSAPIATATQDDEESNESQEMQKEEEEKEEMEEEKGPEDQEPEEAEDEEEDEEGEEIGKQEVKLEDTGADAQMVAVPPDEDPEAVTDGQIVVADSTAGAETWTSTLPAGASSPWTVTGDVCSLQIAATEMKLPKSVYDRLYGYQRQCVAWMWNLFHKGFGGILADEMGLGKTVQTAAFLACLKFTQQGSRFLVVVPVTLLEQWRRELATWTENTGLSVHIMHGAPHERKAALKGLANRGGVLLVSYDLVRTCIHHLRTAGLAASTAKQNKKRKRQEKRGVRDDDSPSEEEEEEAEEPPPLEGDEKTPWDVIVVDEGHQIKNPSCQSGRALRRLEARSRFLLTGTPLQNKLSDLWALMDFAQPALLGNHATFERNFSEQIAKGSKRNASRFAVELKDHLARELKRLTAPHFLRRLKCEVTAAKEGSSSRMAGSKPSELPPKMDVVLWLNLTAAQTELYNLSLKSDLVRNASGANKCGMEALRAIALLKKLCGHPLQCLPQEEYNHWRTTTLVQAGQASSSAPAAAEASQVAEESHGDEAATQPAPEVSELLPRLRALLPNSPQSAALLSVKLRVLGVLLPQLQKRGHRCLIFSQSTRMLDLIQACVLRVSGLKFLRIDGTIDPKDRDVKLQKFQQPDSKYFALCLSMQVGGTGLTVTAADRVILVDPAWNPSADAQAIDRVHRLGQTKPVVVYRLICSGAIEDKMFRLQIFKRGVSKTFMEHEQQVRFFTHKQLKQLFEPPNQSTSTQSLMAEQIGTEALEHEDLLKVVAADVGETDDPDALTFWQSSDVLGFSDYQRLFMFLEQADKDEQQEEAEGQAKELTARLTGEEYVKRQVLAGKWQKRARDAAVKENVSPQEAESLPLQNA